MNPNTLKYRAFIKAELSARNTVNGLVLAVFMAVALAFAFWGGNSIDEALPALQQLVTAAVSMLWVSEMVQMHRYKRVRLWGTLPVSRRSLAVLRVLPMLIMSGLCLAVFILVRLWVGVADTLTAEVLLAAGAVLVMNGLVFVYSDLQYGFKGVWAQAAAITAMAIMILSINASYIYITLKARSGGQVWQDVLSITGLNLYGAMLLILGLAFTGLSLYLFDKRSFYLEA